MNAHAQFDYDLAAHLKTLSEDGIIGLKGAFSRNGRTRCART